jgi:hypothetical protein
VGCTKNDCEARSPKNLARVFEHRSFGKALRALNRTVEFDGDTGPTMAKVWGKNHLTILIQHDWLHLGGAAAATLVCKFIRNISRKHQRWSACPLYKDAGLGSIGSDRLVVKDESQYYKK